MDIDHEKHENESIKPNPPKTNQYPLPATAKQFVMSDPSFLCVRACSACLLAGQLASWLACCHSSICICISLATATRTRICGAYRVQPQHAFAIGEVLRCLRSTTQQTQQTQQISIPPTHSKPTCSCLRGATESSGDTIDGYFNCDWLLAD